MNIEQLDAYADKLEAEGMVEKSALVAGAKATPAELIATACKLYNKVKPFLDLYVGLWFVPEKWRKPVQTFMIFMNGFCPAV